MEEEVCTTPFDTKVARLKWKLILQGKSLPITKHKSGNRTLISLHCIGCIFIRCIVVIIEPLS